jgi:hypothetical protein
LSDLGLAGTPRTLGAASLAQTEEVSTRALGAGDAVEIVVGEPVAVLVAAVARLGRIRPHRGISIVAVRPAA